MDVNCYYCDYYDEEQDCCINGYFSDNECSKEESEVRKMRSITLYAESGYADYYKTIKVPDDTTDEELDEMAQEFMNDHICYGWSEN